ncbi:sensor domain-containing diguanylate cyclase [Caldimonas brevitalea]|nr:diguanylate cyclase [Caldimonas brevitalea]
MSRLPIFSCGRLLLHCAVAGLLWLFCATLAMAAPTPVPLSASARVPLSGHAQLLEDASRAMTLAQVRQRDTGWQQGPSDALNVGFSRSVWWVRVAVRNSTGQPLPVVFDLGSPLQDEVEWFLVRRSGELMATNRSGDRQPFHARGIDHRTPTLPALLPVGEPLELYLRLDSHDGLHEMLPLSVSGEARFYAQANLETLLLGLYHGALLALTLYNLFLYVSTRERAFAPYVAYLGAFLLWSFTFSGLGFQYFWPGSPNFNNAILAIAVGASISIFGFFAQAYIRAPEIQPPWCTRLMRVLSYINLLAVLPALFDHYTLAFALSIPASLLLLVVCSSSAVWAMVRGSREALVLCIAFAVLGISCAIYYLKLLHVLPSNGFSTWALQIGSCLEVLLLAFGLADSMNTLKAQKLEAERAAREAQAALTTRLDQQVRERTDELEQVNRRLGELAITDELTGAYNRRHFNDIFRDAVHGVARSDPWVLCMFDIDHFKAYNDHYGHQAGDEALRTIVHAVQQQLKRSGDRLFRLGGEEFGVLYTAASPEAARQFAAQLREAVVHSTLPHPTSPLGRVTASFGAIWWSGHGAAMPRVDDLYAAADRALYEAKQAGRDRVILRAFEAAAEPDTSGDCCGASRYDKLRANPA